MPVFHCEQFSAQRRLRENFSLKHRSLYVLLGHNFLFLWADMIKNCCYLGMPGTTMPLSPHCTIFAMETHALSQRGTISMGQEGRFLTRVAGQRDTQCIELGNDNTLDYCLSFLFLSCLYAFCVGKLLFGANIGFAICFCVSSITLILIIYDSRANTIQITSFRSHFFCFRFQRSFSKPAKNWPCLDSNAIEILIFLFLYLTPCPINFSKP